MESVRKFDLGGSFTTWRCGRQIYTPPLQQSMDSQTIQEFIIPWEYQACWDTFSLHQTYCRRWVRWDTLYPTKDQIVDILTKNFNPKRHAKLLYKLGVVSKFTIKGECQRKK